MGCLWDHGSDSGAYDCYVPGKHPGGFSYFAGSGHHDNDHHNHGQFGMAANDNSA